MKIITTAIIVICVIFMSTGYSALKAELNITGEAVLEVQKGIEITDVYTKDIIDDATELYNPTFTLNTTNVGVTFPNETSQITIVVEVTNTTNDYYQFDKVTELNNNNPNIKYEIVNEENKFLIAKRSEKKLIH